MPETFDSEYKDDADEFAQTSDLAIRGSTGAQSGGGPETTSASFTPSKGQQAWQGGTGATRPHESDDVHSRSDDPGESSYGGFKNEGPATEGGHPKQ